jgi:hypothetical protein
MDKNLVATELYKVAKDLEAVDRGPVLMAVNKHWNKLHDIENALESTVGEYDMAASYKGKPGEKAAKELVRDIKAVISKLEAISMKEFGKLADKEQKFVNKYGTPEQYADRVRAEIFPV